MIPTVSVDEDAPSWHAEHEKRTATPDSSVAYGRDPDEYESVSCRNCVYPHIVRANYSYTRHRLPFMVCRSKRTPTTTWCQSQHHRGCYEYAYSHTRSPQPCSSRCARVFRTSLQINGDNALHGLSFTPAQQAFRRAQRGQVGWWTRRLRGGLVSPTGAR